MSTSSKKTNTSDTPKKTNKIPPMFTYKAGQGKTPEIQAGNPISGQSEITVLGIYTDGELSTAAKRANTECEELISTVLKTDLNPGKAGYSRTLFNTGSGTKVYVLVGLGDKKEFTAKGLVKATKTACTAIKTLPFQTVYFTLNQELSDKKSPAHDTTALCARTIVESFYEFTACKQEEESPKPLPSFQLASTKSTHTDIAQGCKTGTAVGLGMNLAQDLGNLPGNICTPSYLAETAKQLTKHYKLKLDVLDTRKMEALGMFSLLSVGKGSSEPPKLIVLHYTGAKNSKDAPYVLVGKGITFDTGGISLKPGLKMDEMKYDMCGAASALGTLKAVAELQLPINLTVVIPTAENMPAGNASKPGDIVVSMSGQTIEILNTDAEGRLILCDALTYVERFKPAAVVDIATLTGACIVALGHINSGLYSPDDDLANSLFKAGQQALDTAWRMPLDEEYHEQLKSNFADMANIGGPPAGSITAACFLQKYTKAYTWAHLDIAGTAWNSNDKKGASGRPVPLLTQFLLNKAH